MFFLINTLFHLLYQTTAWSSGWKITEPDNLETVLDLEGNVEIFSNFGILACQEALVSYEPHLEVPKHC